MLDVVNLGNNVEYLRIRMGFSKEQLAEVAGVSVTTISKIEQAKTPSPGAPLLHSLSRIFGATFDELHSCDIKGLDKRQQAVRRLMTNFNDSEWEVMMDVVNGATLRQCEEGRFR